MMVAEGRWVSLVSKLTQGCRFAAHGLSLLDFGFDA